MLSNTVSAEKIDEFAGEDFFYERVLNNVFIQITFNECEKLGKQNINYWSESFPYLVGEK